MSEPSAVVQRVIFLLFPELADRFRIDWESMEFSAKSWTQIHNVLDALAVERTQGWTEGYAAASAGANR